MSLRTYFVCLIVACIRISFFFFFKDLAQIVIHVSGLLSAENENTWMLLRLDMQLMVSLAREANSVMKLLATKKALKLEKPLSEETGWVRVTAILRATNLCIRGSRVKWRSAVHMDDGAGLPTSAYDCMCYCACA